ncbi:uncharacterized protein LOC119381140 [Rhipicephalus sanguineus]|uniref:uncharacterized protein LOC119381140 n=1 Tax=Rhipicephalus sanguineus TaxID=34632 RepID=UPI00189358CF|nr:uncharacterized protein LOC119381140 [Rhipicephalus sanguineus]
MAEAIPRKGSRGRKYCCVVGCHNSTYNSKARDPPLKLYRFPGKWYEKERRKAWITAVRRINPDGTLWLPKEYTRICSAHFVGNCKSDVSGHPSYIPTIFPPVYRKKEPKRQRAQRWETRLNRLVSYKKLVTGNDQPSRTTADGATMQESETSTLADVPRDLNVGDFSDASLETFTASASYNSTSNLHLLVEACGGAEESNCAPKEDAICQTEECVTPGKLSIFLSVTNGTEASTQVVHTEMSHKLGR